MNLSPARTARLARKMLNHLAHGTTDLAAEVRTFDASVYVDEQVAREEHAKVFAACPVAVAHRSQLPEAGDFLTLRMNRHDVLLTRQVDGRVGAFVNACRHRGATLVEEPCGRRKSFTCPYHGWTYAVDGGLRGIGFPDTYGPVDRAANALINLPVEERHGLIWVVEQPGAVIDIAAFLGEEMDALLAESGLAYWSYARGEVLELPQNWKIMADGLLDGYHVQFLHGASIAPHMHHNIMAVDIYGRHAFHATPRKRISEIADKEPGSAPLNRYCIFSIMLAPNTQLVIHPHHSEFWTFFQNPEMPTRCFAHVRFLTPEPITDAEHKVRLDKNYNILISAVMKEDVPAGNGVQRSAAMPAVTTLQLGRNEVLNQMFHIVYETLMAGRGWRAAPEPVRVEGSELSSGSASDGAAAKVA